MRAVILLAALAFCSFSANSQRYFHSRVNFVAPGATFEGDVIKLKVGHRFFGRISPFIGFAVAPPEGGQAQMVESHIKDPEFAYWGDLPPGLEFNAASGVVQGIPTHPGTWVFTVAARDKNDLHNKYSGQGFWGTVVRRVDGVPWALSKHETILKIE